MTLFRFVISTAAGGMFFALFVASNWPAGPSFLLGFVPIWIVTWVLVGNDGERW